MTPTLFLLTLSGCKYAADNALAPNAQDPETVGVSVPAPRTLSLQVNVLPSQVRDSAAPDAGYRALPQTFLQQDVDDATPLSLGALNLVSPVLQTGQITAYRVNPNVADLPGANVPVLGLVQVLRTGSVQSYLAGTDEFGSFQTWIVPGVDYAMQVIPDDPLLPMQSTTFDVSDPMQDATLDLGAGVPIYGFATVGEAPMVGARVHVVDEHGATSAIALTDSTGYYQVRVEPGSWTVVCEGRAYGRDPTVTMLPQDVTEVGAEVNLAYPVLSNGSVEGSVADADGNPAKGATVRLVSSSLLEVGNLPATWTTDIPVLKTGTFFGAVVPGAYTVEVLPPASDRGNKLTPVAQVGAQFHQDYNTLEPIVFSPLVSIAGVVRGTNGNNLASAHVLCREEGFNQRSYETFTKANGDYNLDVPNVPLVCEIAPPAVNDHLASGLTRIDPTTGTAFDFTLDAGETVDGQVLLDGVPEPYAVVEIRDGLGTLLGTGLTNRDGNFEIPVDLRSAASDPL